MDVKTLRDEDRARVAAFLARHAASSMFLQSNLQRAGLQFVGQRYGGVWVGAIEQGEILGVACHAWNGNLLMQAPEHGGKLAVQAVERSGRRLKGIAGPLAHVGAALDALRGRTWRTVMNSDEDLYELKRAALVLPPGLVSKQVSVRRATPADLDVLSGWRAAYNVEANGSTAGTENDAISRTQTAAMIAEDNHFLVEDKKKIVGMSTWNAAIRDCVQIGGVYVPPDLRARGYARCCVAGSLVLAKPEVKRAILFTGRNNEHARRAYLALGFEIVGDYAIVLFG